MPITLQSTLFASLLAAVLHSPFSVAQSDVAPIPKHLALARDLVEHVKPADNHYSLGNQTLSFPGDLFSNGYAVQADCSGLLLALFERAKYPTQSQMRFLVPRFGRKRPAAEDFVFSIENEKGFVQIKDVASIRPGDLLAHAMLDPEDQRQTGTTGHVFLIDSYPKKIPPRKPVVEGTEQFEVAVIDSNLEYTGPDDSRLADPSNKVQGLGRGTIRVYFAADGALAGWARTFDNTNRFFSYNPRFPSDTKLRKAAIGRPVEGS